MRAIGAAWQFWQHNALVLALVAALLDFIHETEPTGLGEVCLTMTQTQEKNQSLWLLTAAPVVWAAHFLLCYITASLWCAKVAGPGGSLTAVRAAIGIYTVVALIGIGIVGWGGYRRHSYGVAELPHDDDTPADRHRFLGFATLLLAALSAVAVVYAALVAVFVERCY